jgi:hypothetical protein
MIVGNRVVAGLIPNSDDLFSEYRWLSVVYAESPFEGYGWSAVDFISLQDAQYDLEQWWHHAARGQCYDPRLHCDQPNCGCRAGA